MDQHLINRIVEAALLAANQPLTLAQLHALFPEEQPAPNGSVELALETLRDGCAERGVELVELASGFRFQVKADVHAWVARMWTERKTKYTRATLETLALIAYRQPITRGEIEQVRGVAVSSNIIQALEEREWIRVVGHRDVPGKPALFGTTKAFLDYFGLKRLDELPPLSELKDIGELEPELQFDNVIDKPIEAGGVAAPGVEASDEGDADASAQPASDDDADDDGDEAGAAGGDEATNDADAGGEQAGGSDEAGADGASHAEGGQAEGDGEASLNQDNDDAGQSDAQDLGDQDDTPYASDGEPEAAPGEREHDEAGSEPFSSDDAVSNEDMGEENDSDPGHAVETTTVPSDDDAA